MKSFFKKSTVFLLGLGICYLILLIYPQPFFAHHYQWEQFHIHSDRSIPTEITSVLAKVKSSIQESELYKSKEKLHVFICQDNWRFFLFTRNKNAGGLVNFLISPHVFIRECNIAENKLIPPGGWMYQMEDRPLSYFMAHELTHSLQRKRSPLLIVNTPGFILEGYADYIGKPAHLILNIINPCTLAMIL